jgi:hypothetical protein
MEGMKITLEEAEVEYREASLHNEIIALYKLETSTALKNHCSHFTC